jgi:Putative transmembrane protein (PGPGW)
MPVHLYNKIMAGGKTWWKSVPTVVRKPIVFALGSVFVAVGIAGLALPIVPGWAAIFLGFAVLATEFAFAERVRVALIDNLKHPVRTVKRAAKAGWRAIKTSWQEPWTRS